MNGLIAAVEPLAIRKKFPKNQVLFFQGEVPRSAYIVQRGLVKVYNISSAGNEQIAAFFKDGDMFPLPWIFDKSSTALFYYETVTDCTILTVDKRTLLDTIFGNPKLLKNAFGYAIEQYIGTLLRITALEQARANEKIMYTFYYLAHRYSTEVQPGKFSVKMNLTHSVIADMIGLTRETTNYELNKLKKAGAIRYAAREYIIDKAVLERLMGEDSFSDLLT